MSVDEPSDPIPEKPQPKVGSYQLIHSLGAGGMSSVFQAVHVETGHEVALKVLPRSLARNPTLLQRFLREAKCAESLQHPNIVAIYDRGIDQGRHYIVLEFIPGGDVHDQVRAAGPMALAEALAVIRPVAEGLQYAASRGLIHRDIKPANLLKPPDGHVKITDLGLALQSEDEEDERVTREGTTVGTVDYMAPEQARDSRATSIRSDIYSLGCTLYFLLTGQPPYPGGDVADKLNRHINFPAPDPRDIRPELPPALSRLISRMMAKKPEQRFADYDELITALDVVTCASDGAGPTPAPLYALIDDEDDEDAPPGEGSGLFHALPGLEGDLVPASDPAVQLLAFDDRSSPPRPSRNPPSGTGFVERASRPSAMDLFDEVEHEAEEPVEGELLYEPAATGARRMSQSEKSWIWTWVLIGVGLVLLVIGADQLIRSSQPEPPTRTEPVVRDQVVREPIVKDSNVVAKPSPPSPPRPPVEVAAKSAPGRVPRPVAPTPKPEPKPDPPAWTEPADPKFLPVPEPDYGTEAEALFLPEWARAEIPKNLPGKFATVQRIADPRDPDQRTSLRAALEVIGVGTIELADDGPFFETGLRIAPDSRLIRARPGFRPILAVERLKPAEADGRLAFLDLADRSLVLDGIDLVVDVADLPRSATALFLCRGGSLTLSNCTVTIVNNRPGQAVSLVRAGPAERPSKIRLERTLVRGVLTSAVDLSGGPAEVVLNRSVVFNGQGSAVSIGGAVAGERGVFLVRSLLATKASAVELGDPGPSGRPRCLNVRALGTTFAHFQSPARTSALAARGEAGTPNELLNWKGDYNTFIGWSGWLSTANERSVPVPRIDDARGFWPGTDLNSKWTLIGWILGPAPDSIVPANLLAAAPNQASILAAVARPSAFAREKTVGWFPRPDVPGRGGRDAVNATGPVTRPVRVAAPAPLENLQSGARMGADPRMEPDASTSAALAGAAPGLRELVFDAESLTLSGDLGRFLAQSVRANDKLVRVRVRGKLPHFWSPLRLPDGVSLEVIVEPDREGLTPSWSAAKSAQGEALIEVRHANVVLSGVVLSRDGSSRLKHLFRVESGHLVLNRCRLTSAGAAQDGGGGLIAFHAPGSRPLSLSERPIGPFEKDYDRPICRISETVLITGGDVLSAEVGRGLVALSQCAVAAGHTVFALSPDRVARDRFDADLSLDHCTIASETNVVTLGAWPGTDPGPDRPWLVSTENCAFFGSYERTTRDRETMMLRTDPGAFARGVLFWQSVGDAFELPCFTASGDAVTPATRRADVTRNWFDLWGVSHFHGSSGPRGTGAAPQVRLIDRLQPGKVTAADLAIDPESITKGRMPKSLGVDLSRLGITPATRAARKR